MYGRKSAEFLIIDRVLSMSQKKYISIYIYIYIYIYIDIYIFRARSFTKRWAYSEPSQRSVRFSTLEK